MITTSDTVKNPYKMCRENSGLSQEYAAGLLHIAPRTLSDYENDKTTVPDDIVMAMGKIYDTNFLVWWHLKYRTPYGEILPEIYEPSTVGDMMFSYVLARDATDDSYESFKDVYEDRQLQISEIPRLEEAIRKAEGAASNLTAIALFARKKIQECEEINILIKTGLASKWELENCYTLDEALKLYALHQMDVDIENARFHEAEEKRR